jgi:hypothetical protein
VTAGAGTQLALKGTRYGDDGESEQLAVLRFLVKARHKAQTLPLHTHHHQQQLRRALIDLQRVVAKGNN